MEWTRSLFSLLLALSVWAGSGHLPVANLPLPQPDPFSDRYPAEILVDNPGDYQFVIAHLYDVDRVHPQEAGRKMPTPGEGFIPLRVIAYIDPVEAELLSRAGLTATPIPNESRLAASLYGPGLNTAVTWPTYDAYVIRWQGIAAAYPNITRLVQIGSSVQGRAMWCLKITDNPDLQEIEPEVKFSGAIHGDETTGTELTTRLAELLVGGYGSDPRLTGLVNDLETWICPIHNPDGYANSSRYNANGEDLNRIFPDPITNPLDTTLGQEPENAAFMQLGYDNRFRLGINYHGGALVVNYPLDSIPYSPPYYAPDNDLLRELSRAYANLNPTILAGGFEDGVTVGWEWYIVRGGMQDWAYHWRDELHVTIEVSQTKKPSFTALDDYWNDNREAMLVWMEQALTGVVGVVSDEKTGLPLDATVTVAETNKTLRTDADAGDYHRPLLPGVHTLTAAATCHLPQEVQITVPAVGAAVQNFALQPTGVSGVLRDQATGLPVDGVVRILDAIGEAFSAADSGEYDLSVCPGTYTLQVEAVGYEMQEKVVTVGSRLVVNFDLVSLPLLNIYLPAILN